MSSADIPTLRKALALSFKALKLFSASALLFSASALLFSASALFFYCCFTASGNSRFAVSNQFIQFSLIHKTIYDLFIYHSVIYAGCWQSSVNTPFVLFG